ncbi:MAG: tRNA pseudouridine55 synthase, partial [Abditibacteriota bacterium]|nr:tRNA pseudouridine55 synthase [Abditibacteriota bacterium]
VLNVLKPPGLTSHDVVGLVRRVVGTKRVGHTGTLDPAAAGVLPVCINQATRLVEYLQAGTKEYTAEITFGYETDTLDAEGKVLWRGESGHIDLENLRRALDAFRGEIEQIPPLYSAIKKDGKKLYELAREGVEDVEIPTRRVTISHLEASRFMAGTQSTLPRAVLHIECSGGTYIRSLLRDIGHALGTFATMTFLVRTRSGSFRLDEAHTLEAIQNDWRSALLPITQALSWSGGNVVIDDAAMENLAHGRPARPAQSTNGAQRVIFFNTPQTVAAIAELKHEQPGSLPAQHGVYQAEKVFFLDRD